MSLEKRLEGRVLMITGASSGIGLACAERFVREGAIVAGFDLAEPPDAWKAIEEACPGASFTVGDVRDEAAQNAWAAEVKTAQGRIDGIVTAAGVASGGPVHLIPTEEWQRVQDINLTGTFLSAPCSNSAPARSSPSLPSKASRGRRAAAPTTPRKAA
jgi:NAD(P)-dependent dehydrogenase (short-subunit alcohol dehydrogenase family)